jgi:hypothetical protein
LRCTITTHVAGLKEYEDLLLEVEQQNNPDHFLPLEPKLSRRVFGLEMMLVDGARSWGLL